MRKSASEKKSRIREAGDVQPPAVGHWSPDPIVRDHPILRRANLAYLFPPSPGRHVVERRGFKSRSKLHA